jgi:hypothetical protein
MVCGGEEAEEVALACIGQTALQATIPAFTVACSTPETGTAQEIR